MKPFILKHSISRKSLHTLSRRQRRKITYEIRNNLKRKENCTQSSLPNPPNVSNIPNVPNNIDNLMNNNISNIQYISSPSHVDSSFALNLDNDIEKNSMFILNVEHDLILSNDNRASDDDSSSVSMSSVEPLFEKRLASCFVNNKFSHVQANNLLSVLRTHPSLYNLPKDVRTLINTPRGKVAVSKIEPGEYIHFNVEERILRVLSRFRTTSLPNLLEIDFNTDGCYLDKSGSIHIWPIQCRLVNIEYTRPIIVGIYKGPTKPNNPNLFFEKFVADIKKILSNGGISYHERKIPIRLRCFIADAPARAFILNHRSHTSQKPCSKCKISGMRYEGRNVFCGVNHCLRTDDEYATCLDEDHQKDGKSLLSMLPIGMVSQVPYEYMHLVCLGVMKKLLSAWVYGKYSRFSKLSAQAITSICTQLEILTAYCPSEFARRPRSLSAYTKCKATEYRQFLLYSVPVVTYNILKQKVHTHSLFLHVAIRILVSTSSSEAYFNFADYALQKFVTRSENLYSPAFCSYNVHGLTDLTNDVQ